MARKRQFDDTSVLTLIADHFWQYGYQATRMDELAKLTGLTKTSLYNAFGNKEALFKRVVDLYRERHVLTATTCFDNDKPLLDNLRTMLEQDFLHRDAHSRHGCLINNSQTELSSAEPELYDYVRQTQKAGEDALTKVFQRYVEKGELTADARSFTLMLFAFRQGLKVRVLQDAPVAELREVIELFLRMVKGL